MIISLPRYRIGQRVTVTTIVCGLRGTVINCKVGRNSEMETIYDVLAENGARILATESLVEPDHYIWHNPVPPEAA